MTSLRSKAWRTGAGTALCLLVIGLMAYSVGCRMPGKVVSTTKSDVCPMCRNEVRTTPLKGLTYTKHVCPGCKTVSTIDPAAPASMRDYIDPEDRTVHVCEHCEAMVSTCPQCASR